MNKDKLYEMKAYSKALKRFVSLIMNRRADK